MTAEQTSWVQWGFNVLLGLVSFFGALWLRRMESDMEKMQEQSRRAAEKAAERELALQSQLRGYVSREDFAEFRQEQRQAFGQVFDRLDTLADRIKQ